VLGLAAASLVARRVLRRIDAMTGTTQRIMAGDLSGRCRSDAAAMNSIVAENRTPCWSGSKPLMRLKEVPTTSPTTEDALSGCAIAPRGLAKSGARPNTVCALDGPSRNPTA